MKNKKGAAFIWLLVIVSLFGMALIYIVLNEGMEDIKGALGGNFTGTRYETTYTKINSIWDMWLLIPLIGIVVWGILAALRKRDNDVGY